MHYHAVHAGRLQWFDADRATPAEGFPTLAEAQARIDAILAQPRGYDDTYAPPTRRDFVVVVMGA
jgi:hypothetical protein